MGPPTATGAGYGVNPEKTALGQGLFLDSSVEADGPGV